MDLLKVAISVCELFITLIMAVLVVYATYRALIKANTDFDEDEQINKGNMGVGILVAALLLSSANIMHQAFLPVADTIHVTLAGGVAGGASNGALALYALGNLVLAFVIVVLTLSFSLRLFGRLTRTKDTRPGIQLERGNVAVGVILSSFILIVSMFVGEGVSSISKALIPRPNIGRMQMMR